MSTITIPSRFNGPARSGNGGYAAGVVGELVIGPARVKLHAPPPLDVALEITSEADRIVARVDGKTILESSPAAPPGPPPEFVPIEAAQRAKARFAGYQEHAAPTCFVCGVERPDGLGIHPGMVGHKPGQVATPWVPNASITDEAGIVDPRVVWGALDCPGAWAAWSADGDGKQYFPALGMMTAELAHPIHRGEPHVVVAAYESTEGRKLHTSAAIYSSEGELKAHADHVEIKVPYDWAG